MSSVLDSAIKAIERDISSNPNPSKSDRLVIAGMRRAIRHIREALSREGGA